MKLQELEDIEGLFNMAGGDVGDCGSAHDDAIKRISYGPRRKPLMTATWRNIPENKIRDNSADGEIVWSSPLIRNAGYENQDGSGQGSVNKQDAKKHKIYM